MTSAYYIKDALFTSGAHKIQVQNERMTSVELRALFVENKLIFAGHKYRLFYTDEKGKRKAITKENIAELLENKGIVVTVEQGVKIKPEEASEKQGKVSFSDCKVKVDFNGITKDFDLKHMDKVVLLDKIRVKAEEMNISYAQIFAWDGNKFTEIKETEFDSFVESLKTPEIYLKVTGIKHNRKDVTLCFGDEAIPLGKVNFDLDELKGIAMDIFDLDVIFDFYVFDLKTGKLVEVGKNKGLLQDDSVQLIIKTQEDLKKNRKALEIEVEKENSISSLDSSNSDEEELIKKPVIKNEKVKENFACNQCKAFIGETAFISCFETNLILCKECALKHTYPCILKKFSDLSITEELSLASNTLKLDIKHRANIYPITKRITGKPGETVKIVFQLENKGRKAINSNRIKFVCDCDLGMSLKTTGDNDYINSSEAKILEIAYRIEENAIESHEIKIKPILEDFTIAPFECIIRLVDPLIEDIKKELGISSSYKASLIAKITRLDGLTMKEALERMEDSGWKL